MAKKKKTDTPQVAQEESFSLIDERDALIEKTYEKAEAFAEGDLNDQVDVNDEPDAPEEGAIPEIQEPEKPDVEPDYERLKSDYENLKGQNTEEREKRKAKSRELEQTQSQLHEVLQDFKKLSSEFEKLKSSDVDPEFEDPGMNALQSELRDLRKEIRSLRQERDGDKQKTADQKFRESLTETDKALSKEGFPGFYIMRAAVVDELQNMVKDDPENSIYDNPKGWQTIYKEKVWPTVSQHFSKVERDAVIDKKKADKKKANVVTIPGKSPGQGEAQQEEWSFDDYLKMRRGSQVS